MNLNETALPLRMGVSSDALADAALSLIAPETVAPDKLVAPSSIGETTAAPLLLLD